MGGIPAHAGTGLAPETPKGGITNGGYKIVYNDDMPEWVKHVDTSHCVGFEKSLGFVVKPEGDIQEVLWNSPAFKAGITPDNATAGSE